MRGCCLLGSTPASATTATDNIIGQDMSPVNASTYQGVKWVLVLHKVEGSKRQMRLLHLVNQNYGSYQGWVQFPVPRKL